MWSGGGGIGEAKKRQGLFLGCLRTNLRLNIRDQELEVGRGGKKDKAGAPENEETKCRGNYARVGVRGPKT